MIDIGYDETIYTADWSRGTITVELYLDNIKMASATYELARQAGGVDGSYEYLITNAPIIKKLTDAKGDVSYEPNTITLTLLKRVGDKDPVTSTATRWAKTYIDGELTTEKQSFQGSLTVNGEVTTEVKVEVFADEACTSIIDREIVPVIADGVDAYNSAVITVYCRTDKDPVPPGKAEYDFNQKNQHQSLVWTSSSNGWSLEPQPDDGLGTTRYKSMVSIRNREHLHKIAEDDWSSAIVDELPKTYEEVLTFYTTVVLPQDKTPEEVKPSKPIIPTYNIKERKFEGNLPSGWT
jgi:molybdopterin-binding protein